MCNDFKLMIERWNSDNDSELCSKQISLRLSKQMNLKIESLLVRYPSKNRTWIINKLLEYGYEYFVESVGG